MRYLWLRPTSNWSLESTAPGSIWEPNFLYSKKIRFLKLVLPVETIYSLVKQLQNWGLKNIAKHPSCKIIYFCEKKDIVTVSL